MLKFLAVGVMILALGGCVGYVPVAPRPVAYAPVYQPAYAYTAPAYYAPAPVYYQPAPVYYQPAYEPAYYAGPSVGLGLNFNFGGRRHYR